ncbi:MAG: uroporphyrinogen decarboxylase family protein [Promethearchaeota archaeon]
MEKIQEEAMTSVERVLTSLQLKEPDRVPVWPLIDFLPAYYLEHINIQNMLENPDKAQEGMEWIYHKMGGFDIAMAGGAMYMMYFNPFPDMFSAYYLDWRLPGRQLPVDIPPQLAEKSLSDPFLKAEDYDRILNEGFFWLVNFNSAGMKDLMNLGKIAPKVVENTRKWWEVFKVPTFTDGAGATVFDLLSTFRGSTNFMKDIYRHKDKILEIIEKYTDDFILMGEYGISNSQGKTILVGGVRASSDFISIKHFEELFWPYFKKTISTYVKKGYIVQMHMDTNWTDRLHYFRELPKGKLYLHIDERTDIFKAKEILGDYICIEGNLKPSLFTVGTPNLIEKKVREIIDKCADSGGLMVGSEIPDDAKLENVKAMIDACKKYGQYRK